MIEKKTEIKAQYITTFLFPWIPVAGVEAKGKVFGLAELMDPCHWLKIVD